MQKGTIYYFYIVKAKYSAPKRWFLSIVIILSAILGFPFLHVYVLMDIKCIAYFHPALYFLYLILDVVLMYAILILVVEKTYKIGILTVYDEKLNLTTKKINREIFFDEIQRVKLKGATGMGKSTETMKTILVSIILYEGEIINIHSTREYLKTDNIQKTNMFTKKIDLWDILIKNKINTKVDRKLREKDCIKE